MRGWGSTGLRSYCNYLSAVSVHGLQSPIPLFPVQEFNHSTVGIYLLLCHHIHTLSRATNYQLRGSSRAWRLSLSHVAAQQVAPTMSTHNYGTTVFLNQFSAFQY